MSPSACIMHLSARMTSDSPEERREYEFRDER